MGHFLKENKSERSTREGKGKKVQFKGEGQGQEESTLVHHGC